jgi:hypothetical protein
MKFGRGFGRPKSLAKFKFSIGALYMELYHVFVHWQIDMLALLSTDLYVLQMLKIFAICSSDALEHWRFGMGYVWGRSFVQLLTLIGQDQWFWKSCYVHQPLVGSHVIWSTIWR